MNLDPEILLPGASMIIYYLVAGAKSVIRNNLSLSGGQETLVLRLFSFLAALLATFVLDSGEGINMLGLSSMPAVVSHVALAGVIVFGSEVAYILKGQPKNLTVLGEVKETTPE
jgi:hypothetical protein